MLRRAFIAIAFVLSAFGLSAAAQATTFGFGFLIDFQNGDGAIGQGDLFTTDNGDGTFTVTGVAGNVAFVTFPNFDIFGGATLSGVGPSFFADANSVPTIVFADGVYSFDNLQLFGDDRFFDFSHAFGPDLVGFSGEVGGPAQFQFGIDASPAPELASWGMMVMGFTAVGAAMRRRRTVVTFA